MFLFCIARFTIMIASCRLLSTSAMNCSAPPLSTKVHVFAAGHPSKKLNLSPPICRSSNRSQEPRCCGWISEHVEDMLPPVACTTRSRSSEETRPAQKTSRSAKYLYAYQHKFPRSSLGSPTGWPGHLLAICSGRPSLQSYRPLPSCCK